MSRLRRFLHIERSRPLPDLASRGGGGPGTSDGATAPDGEPGSVTARRIGGVEPSGAAPAGPGRSGAGLDRFAAPAPPSIELARTAEGERPFTRCGACGMDHHVAAVQCAGCGARLDTEANRALNEELWRERLAETAKEAEADAARRVAREEADAQATRDRRAAAESLAREVGAAERRRLDVELGSGGDVIRAGRRLVEWLMKGR